MTFYFITSVHGVESTVYTDLKEVTRKAYDLKKLNAYSDASIEIVSWNFHIGHTEHMRTIG